MPEITIKTGKKFTCGICGREFTSKWSEKEAIAELEKNFGAIPLEECDEVCDECYKKAMPLHPKKLSRT